MITSRKRTQGLVSRLGALLLLSAAVAMVFHSAYASGVHRCSYYVNGEIHCQ
jgi:hypothetical protein